MGTSYTFHCSDCGYRFESTGKTSSGMQYVVRPYICKDCNILTDVCVGMYGESFLKEEFNKSNKKLFSTYMKENMDTFFKCEECNGENLVDWDSKDGDCPKCNGSLSIDKDAPVMCWD